MDCSCAGVSIPDALLNAPRSPSGAILSGRVDLPKTTPSGCITPRQSALQQSIWQGGEDYFSFSILAFSESNSAEVITPPSSSFFRSVSR